LCECGGQISRNINLDRVADAISLEVKRIMIIPMLCTPDTLDVLPAEISEFSHVVFGACTPKRIEKTVEEIAKKAEINPYLTHIVNLREQCAWTSENADLATDKAINLVRGAIKRIRHHEALEEKYININPDVVIVGGGVAGIFAALTLSKDTRRRVYLIEKDSYIGGKTIAYEELTPNFTCAQCLLAPSLQDILEKSNIMLYTNAEIKDAKGSLGNFLLKVSQKPRYVDVNKCIGCGECIEACPVEVPNDYEYGMKKRSAIYFPYPGVLPNVPVINWEDCLHKAGCQKCVDACAFDAIDFGDVTKEFDLRCGAIILTSGFSVYPIQDGHRTCTSPRFERLLAKNGPTEGRILLPNGDEPKSIAIIHCIGREELGYCSKICCSVALKYSYIIRSQLPDCEIHHVYTELVLPHLHSKLYHKISKTLKFHRRLLESKINIEETDRSVIIEYKDEKGDQRLKVDMAVLMCGITPSPETKRIAEIFDVKLNEQGFIEVIDIKISPIEASAGILVAGGVLGPCSVEEAVQQAIAAAGEVFSKLFPGDKILIEPKVCVIDEGMCSGCKICISLCPYGAILYDDGNCVCVIDEVFCKGCGTCASACPTGAIKAQHYTTEQIYAEIEGVVR
jgi:heterodisulfide reductase subunit A